MVDPIINATVLVLFGLTIGAVLQLHMLLSGGLSGDILRRKESSTQREPGRRFDLRRLIRVSQEQAQHGRHAIRTMPRSTMLLMAAFYGLIGVLILFMKYGPFEMSWLLFLCAVLAGFIVMDRVFVWAKAGKIRSEGQSFFDILPAAKKDQ